MMLNYVFKGMHRKKAELEELSKPETSEESLYIGMCATRSFSFNLSANDHLVRYKVSKMY